MSPIAQYVTNICAESTEDQRIKALEVAASAIPHIDHVYGEVDFFLFTAFALDFIKKGRIPNDGDWDAMVDFLNGRTKGTA